MKNNLVEVKYHQTGKSKKTNELGMREMQARAYEKRTSQYLLVKAPPASGKSRALMFIGLDKLHKQGLKKVIVAVPEKSIGSSFKNTDLKSFGFNYNWMVNERNNLTTPGTDKSKVQRFIDFMQSDDEILICTHATLRFAYEKMDDSVFDNCLLAIDEFHHVSADANSVLGNALRSIIRNSTAHIIAMTGSYFRGDSTPILDPADEEKFDKVTYTYYEQLDGYQYLKSFGIGYHFYKGKYSSAISEILDTNKKTIIHIPNVRSIESIDKYDAVDIIMDAIGDYQSDAYQYQDEVTGIHYVKNKDGKVLKVADLVTDNANREKVTSYIRRIEKLEDLDIIIALGMAKEGFDWPWCEHALTIGYRGSLTEIVQIIGRCTRDSSNKTHAQFTNLIAQPDAQDNEVTYTVNTMLKAISASLLMEQVLTPNLKFKRKREGDEPTGVGEIFIKGLKEPSTEKVKDIIEKDILELKAGVLSDASVQKAMISKTDSTVVNKVLIPKVIQKLYPDLSEEEIEEVRQHLVTDMALKSSSRETRETDNGSREFIRMGEKFVAVEELSIDLIDTINPFQRAFAVMSKEIDSPTLRIIQNVIDSQKIDFDEAELLYLAPKIIEFKKEHGRLPNKNSRDEFEKRLAFAFSRLAELRGRKQDGQV